MSIQELMPFLQKVSADILIISIIVFILTNIIKKFVPEKYKNKIGLIPFILGTLICMIYEPITLKEFDFIKILTKGIQTGGVATFLYAFIKQLLKKENLEKSITEILRGILDSQSLKSAVKKIITDYNSENTFEDNKNLISTIISNNTPYSQEECLTISEIIVNTINSK